MLKYKVDEASGLNIQRTFLLLAKEDCNIEEWIQIIEVSMCSTWVRLGEEWVQLLQRQSSYTPTTKTRSSGSTWRRNIIQDVASSTSIHAST